MASREAITCRDGRPEDFGSEAGGGVTHWRRERVLRAVFGADRVLINLVMGRHRRTRSRIAALGLIMAGEVLLARV